MYIYIISPAPKGGEKEENGEFAADFCCKFPKPLVFSPSLREGGWGDGLWMYQSLNINFGGCHVGL
jgi:hypothetical protein